MSSIAQKRKSQLVFVKKRALPAHFWWERNLRVCLGSAFLPPASKVNIFPLLGEKLTYNPLRVYGKNDMVRKSYDDGFYTYRCRTTNRGRYDR